MRQQTVEGYSRSYKTFKTKSRQDCIFKEVRLVDALQPALSASSVFNRVVGNPHGYFQTLEGIAVYNDLTTGIDS